MTLSIVKSKGLTLTKSITSVRVEAWWDAKPENGPYDVDIMALAINDTAGGVGYPVDGETHVCYFGQKTTPFIKHLKGDNTNGAGDGADEVIQIDLDRLPSEVTLVPVIAILHDAANRRQTFADVAGGVLKLIDNVTNVELATAPLSALTAGSVSAMFAALERNPDNTWKFNNVSEGYTQDLEEWFKLYNLI